MTCHHFLAGSCRSCTLLAQPYQGQLHDKQHAVAGLLGLAEETWLPPVASAEAGCRNKAKMVATGSANELLLTLPRGTLRGQDEPGEQAGAAVGEDLADCPLYPEVLRAVFPAVRALVRRAQVPPYDVARQRGELKHVIVTVSPAGELMVRFVLRTERPVPRLREHLPILLSHTGVQVVTCNIQPEHAAVLEGEREIVLTDAVELVMDLGGVPLHLRPQSFFQTNSMVAAELYAQAARWADQVAPDRVVDLFCGVGGFALHCAGPHGGSDERDVLGVEISPEAVAAARRSATGAGVDATFVAGDAAEAVLAEPARAGDLVIVNPPRRGIGAELCAWLERGSAESLIYSSCNPATLAQDLARLPSFEATQARLFDIFPHTEHAEVAVLLRRRTGPTSRGNGGDN